MKKNYTQSNFSGPFAAVLYNLENDVHCTLLQLYVKMFHCDGHKMKVDDCLK
jgi:hypothetical protein